MMRSLSILALLSVAAGCGVAESPQEESTASVSIPVTCPPPQFWVPDALAVTSAADPWKSSSGTVVALPFRTDYFVAIGWDDTTNAVDWFMYGATNEDIDRFESYPHSRRYCPGDGGGGITDSAPRGSGKGNGDNFPPPGAVCFPSDLPGDAFDAYEHGAHGGSFTIYQNCAQYGPGPATCVAQSCAALHLGCGNQVDNCGQVVYCGACAPPNKCACGGTYPHCRLCE